VGDAFFDPVSYSRFRRGGKAESIHCSKGQHTTHSASDQLATDKSVRALIQTHKEGRRIALLIDDKYVPFPFDIGAIDVTYAVLGFYTIVDCWGPSLFTSLLATI